MMEFFIKYYKEIIALIGSLTGLLGLVMTFYYKFRDSNIRDKELELKKIQFELDKQHQITKDTYQKIFEKKILLYKELNEYLVNYKSNLNDIGIEIKLGYEEIKIITEYEITINTFLLIKELIRKNLFFISKDLENEFKNIKDTYSKALHGFNSEKLLGVYGDHEEVEEAELENTHRKFHKNNKENILMFFNLIENEISEIKRNIGLI